MKPKYSIGDTVRIRATGEKVKILNICRDEEFFYYQIDPDSKYYWNWPEESELKPYRPSRTGKYRDSRGRFIKGWMLRKPEDKSLGEKISSEDWQKGNLNSYLNKTATEIYQDSKQRNYQKILTKLDVLEKKIDELGRKV